MKESGKVVVVLTTLPVHFDGNSFARTLVEERAAACVNIQAGVNSTFRWKDGIECNEEQLVIIKTVSDLVVQLKDLILTLHPYSEPEVLVLPVVGGSVSYLDWIKQSTLLDQPKNQETTD